MYALVCIWGQRTAGSQVSTPTRRVLGIEFGSPGLAASTLSYWAMSTAANTVFKMTIIRKPWQSKKKKNQVWFAGRRPHTRLFTTFLFPGSHLNRCPENICLAPTLALDIQNPSMYGNYCHRSIFNMATAQVSCYKHFHPAWAPFWFPIYVFCLCKKRPEIFLHLEEVTFSFYNTQLLIQVWDDHLDE